MREGVGDDYLDILYTTFLPEPADNTTIHTEKSLLYLKLKFKLFQLIVYAFSCICAHLAVVTAPFCHTGAVTVVDMSSEIAAVGRLQSRMNYSLPQ